MSMFVQFVMKIRSLAGTIFVLMFKAWEKQITSKAEWVQELVRIERKMRYDAQRIKERFNPVYLGDEYDLMEGDRGYRLAPREEHFEDND